MFWNGIVTVSRVNIFYNRWRIEMRNLSQIKRDKMLHFLEKIKKEYKSDEALITISEIENALTEKKYGLIWEEHEEAVDIKMKTHFPVFVELQDKQIKRGFQDGNYNFLIEGDNLQSLKLLEKTHKGRIDIIYIDPPYNTGKKDFIYNDKMVEIDDGFRHSKWLSFMHSRLQIAKKLLSNKGFIFISIDDNELCQLRMLCDEIFGSENFISIISVENNPKGRKNSNFISISNEYCLIYGKSKDNSAFVENIPKNILDVVQDEDGNYIHNSGKRVLVGENNFNDFVTDYSSDKHYSVYYNAEQKVIVTKKESEINENDQKLLKSGYVRYYSYRDEKFVLNTYTEKKFTELFNNNAVEFKKGKIYEKNFNTMIRMKSMLVNRDYQGIVNNQSVNVKIDVKTTSAGTALKELFNVSDVPFSNPKNTGLIKLLISLVDNRESTVLDFFAGSGTTGQAVMELNKEDGGSRKFILCTNNEIDEKELKKYAVENAYINKLKDYAEFVGTEEFNIMLKQPILHAKGICQLVTYPRLKIYITGIREDGTQYSEGNEINLKYYKTAFVPKSSDDEYYSVSEELQKHIKEMVQLEKGVSIEDDNYILLLSDDEADELEKNPSRLDKCKGIYISSGVFLTDTQEKMLKDIPIETIPDYFFESELREVGEL